GRFEADPEGSLKAVAEGSAKTPSWPDFAGIYGVFAGLPCYSYVYKITRPGPRFSRRGSRGVLTSSEGRLAAGNDSSKRRRATRKGAKDPARRDGASGYDARDITVLEGLEAVRKRPGMYVGSTGALGLHHLVYEVIDNSVDEALAGFCSKVVLTIHPDNSITVADNGRGIPVATMEKEGKPAVEVVL